MIAARSTGERGARRKAWWSRILGSGSSEGEDRDFGEYPEATRILDERCGEIFEVGFDGFYEALSLSRERFVDLLITHEHENVA